MLLLFGTNRVDPRDVVAIEEKTLTITIRKSKKNPKPKPKGFLAGLEYSDTVYYDDKATFKIFILKVKSGVQIKEKVDLETGNISVSGRHQLYDFYTVYNDPRLPEYIKDSERHSTLDLGNFYSYPGILQYDDFLSTNMMLAQSVQTKDDLIRNYML